MPWQQTAFGAFTKCIGREGIQGKCMRAHRDQGMYGYGTGRKSNIAAKSPAECKSRGISEGNVRISISERTFKGSCNEPANPLK